MPIASWTASVDIFSKAASVACSCITSAAVMHCTDSSHCMCQATGKYVYPHKANELFSTLHLLDRVRHFYDTATATKPLSPLLFEQLSISCCLCIQVRNLRERLEEEHQALLTREQDKAALELRIQRLTKLILHSTRIGTSTAAARKQRMNLLRSFSEHLCPTVSFSSLLTQPSFNLETKLVFPIDICSTWQCYIVVPWKAMMLPDIDVKIGSTAA